VANKIDVIISAIDNMSPVVEGTTESVKELENQLEQTAEKGSKSNDQLRQTFKNVTAGIAVAGVAMTAYAESQQDLFSSANKAAVGLGMTKGEFNDLAASVSNVTFPLNEAIDLLALAGKQGLKTEEDLTKFANFWDTIGDASGESSIELAKMSTGLRAMGIAAGQEAEALNAYGIILRDTSMDLTKFNELASKNSEAAKAAGMTIDDLAATFSYMQNELGMTVQMMDRQFNDVIENNMDEIKKYQATLGDASEHVQKLADAHGENFSIFDKFKHSISELTLKFQDQIQAAGNIGSVMTGVSAALNIAASAQGFFASMTAAAGAASTAATPGLLGMASATIAATWPILAIIAAIAALVAIIVLVIKNFDKLKEVFSNTLNFMKDGASTILPVLFGPLFITIKMAIKAFEFLRDNWDAVLSGMSSAFGVMIDSVLFPFKFFVNNIITGINAIIKVVNMLGGNLSELNKFDLKIGDMNLSKTMSQTFNVNTTTTLDGKAIAKSTAQTTRRVAASNAI
jgi:hypothetical protein